MASQYRSGSSRRKAEAPGKIRIQLKGKSSKVLNSEDEDDMMHEDETSPLDMENGIPDDLPEGTVVVQPVAVEDAPVKKKRDPPVRIDTSVLDSVSCTACGHQLNPYKGGALQKHPQLKVVICRRCEKFLSSGEIAKDKDGTDEQCRWCGEGGRLVVCDECASAFCKSCVMRNFNRSEFNNINSQPHWKCYLCNKAPLQNLRDNYRKIRDTLKALQLRDKAKAAAAAAPISNGMKTSEKSAGSKQIFKCSVPESAQKGRSVQGMALSAPVRNSISPVTAGRVQASTSQKSNSEFVNNRSESGRNVNLTETGNFTLSLEDINVSYENVDAIMDKLSTATNTFKEMLRALRSQFHATSPRGLDEAPPMFHFSISTSMNAVEKKRRCAKALTMGLETYMKSIKTILTGNLSAEELTTEKDSVRDQNQVLHRVKCEGKDFTFTSQTSHTSLSSKVANSVSKPKETTANGNTFSSSNLSTHKSSKLRSAEQNTSDEFQDSEASRKGKTASSKGKDKGSKIGDSEPSSSLSTREPVEDFVEINTHSTKDGTDAISSKKSDQTKDVDHSTKDTKIGNSKPSSSLSTREPVEDSVEINTHTTKDRTDAVSSKKTDQTRDVDHSTKDTKQNNAAEKSISFSEDSEDSQVGDEETRKENVLQKKNNSQNNRVENDDREEKASSEGKDRTGGESEPDNGKSENIRSSNSSKDKSSEKDIGDKSSSKSSTTVENAENLAAKFDLIRELTSEMLKDDDREEEEEEYVDDDDNTDGEKCKSKCGTKSSSQEAISKRKKADLSSDESDTVSAKRSKGTKASGKLKKDQKKASAEDVTNVSDVSSSDLLMSEDSDENISARRQRRKKRKEITKSADSTKATKQKSEPMTKEEKSQVNGKSKTKSTSNDKGMKTEKDDLDKEIDKLAKMPTMRKRKAKDMDESEHHSEEEAIEESNQDIQASKKSKPGPRSSKKDLDYDGLSSEGDVAKESEEDEDDDEELPPVTFCVVESGEQPIQKGANNENEIAKNGLLEDMENEDDDDDDGNSDDSSSEDDSDVPQKTKSKKKEQDKPVKEEKDENDHDSDDNIGGKRKQIRSKLLDTKLSDSESDVGKTERKKKDSDNESLNVKVEEEEEEEEDNEDSTGSSIESDLTENESESENDSEEEDEDGDSKSKKKNKKRKGKRKKKGQGKKGSDVEDDEEDEDEDGKKKKGKGKKRRRIKKISNSSDDGEEENAEDDDPNSSKAGKRKQIRKVMSNKKLEDSTKAAARAEEKRRKRISVKQREFNIETITDENNPMNCPITTKLILEAAKEEGEEPVIQVNKNLVRKLKPHQVEGVQFMWDCMYESVKRSRKESGAGCILAHCMGLGKTLSVVAFVHTVLSHEKVLKQKTCLVVSPLNTVLNWKNEWSMWLDEEDQLEVWELASCKQNAARADALKDWQESGGIMIMGYEMYRNLTYGNRCKNKRQKKIFQETLVDPGPDLVVCDEGHILKNETSAISKAMNMMKTRRRVVLTGTPLQNNLTEYHCMVSFVKPNLLGTRKEFTNRFISPIQNGQCTDSTPRDFKLMKARAHVLHEMLAGCVQRRDYSALTKFLPPKQEYVISVRLANIQIELYEKYLEITGQGVDGIFTNKGARLFTDYQNLMKIWTHPWVLKLAEIRDEMKVKYDDEDSFIDDESDEERSFSSTSSSSDDEKMVSDSGGEGTSAGPSLTRGTRRTRAKARRQAGEDSDPEEVIAEWKSKTRNGKSADDDVTGEENDKMITKEWWAQYVTEDDKLKLELSNKLSLLFEILRMCEEIGDKVQSILSLNIIESFLEVIDSKFQQDCANATDEDIEKEEFGRSWTKNLDYYRMDGSTSAQNRQAWAASFNDIENYRARLFLISTRAGGLGINLVAANRVIIFDASWNPSHDVQSIFRVYRFGQTKPCYIYRFLAQGTMEEKIYERQVTKLSLSQRVVDEHQIERHFSANDLKELYNFRPDRWDDGTDKPTLALPKDPLLAEILTANKHCVVSFHEHDSLLENQVEQTLTEEEKKAAWEEYENEKKGIIIRGPGMERTASWPMMAAAQILSREQITATVQALRQQLPDISEDLFHLHVQQALRRQVQIKQEEMRRMELLRLQEMNYLNMIKQQAQQSGLTHAQSLQAMQNMAPWMQMQRLRAMQNSMMLGMHHSASMSLLGQALTNPMSAERISNKPEDAIDLDDN